MAAAANDPKMSARAERRAIVALLAAFALLLQVFIPAAAMAGSNAAGGEVICTAHGAVLNGKPAPPAGHRHDGASCDHCVCPIAAAPPPAALGGGVEAVFYAEAVEHSGLGADDCVPGRGLAAPPPPSRGPPQLTI
ncbi:MAG: DUF2946 domain-containing protein [Proteobacteria bacterium]|nr:DUF2946 domain-containing protein [Pseudomonadota bacterium]